MPSDMYACAISGSTKSVKAVPGFCALSAMVRRRSSCGGPFFSVRLSTGFSGGFSSAGGAGLAAIGSMAGLISLRNSSRRSPSAVKMRLSVTFSSLGLSVLVISREFKRLGQKGVNALPGVVRRRLHVARRVVRVHEGVPRAGVDLDVRGLAGGLERLLECLDVLRRDALVFLAEVAEDRGRQRLDGGGIGDEMAVVDDRRGQARLGEREVEREAAAHAPADDADAAGVDVLPRRQVLEGVREVGHGPVVRQPARELVRLAHLLRDLAAIEVGREGDVALRREAIGLLFHPVVEAPPLLDDDDGRVVAVRGGQREVAARFAAEGWVVDRLFTLVRGGDGGDEERETEEEKNCAPHSLTILQLRGGAKGVRPLRPASRN